MSTNNLLLAYSQENTKLAEHIDAEISAYIGPITHIPGGRTTAAPSISEQILDQPGRAILFVSDNFLKSAQCMGNGLRLLQSRGADILPVIIPGEYKDEDTGEVTQVETSFDRVSDIIQYINYWQDQYLDLRRQKRQLEDEIDEDKFNEHLRKMREISSEVGEFLRLLRTTDYITYREFVHNDFEALFSFVGNLPAHDEYRKNRPLAEPSTPPAEAESEAPVPDDAADEPTVDLEEIPGINLLNKEEKPSQTGDAPDEEMEIPQTSEPEQEELIGDASDLYQQESEETPEGTPQEPEEILEDYDHESEEEEEEEDTSYEAPMSFDLGEEEEEEDEEDDDDDEVEAPSTESAVVIAQAFELLENGNTEAGFEHFNKAIVAAPDDANLKYQYAIALVRYQKDFRNASKQLVEAIHTNPELEEAYFLLGELAEITEDFTGAKNAYETLANLNPDFPQVQFRLGIVLANHFEGQEKAAMSALKKAIKQNPDNTDALYQYAVLQSEYHDKPKKAIKYFKATLEKAPDHPFAWYDMAILYHSLNQRKKAYKAYQKAIEINPELKTAENDEAFQILEKEKKKELEDIADSFRERTTIDALKENINQLEALLKAREEELAEETTAKEEFIAQKTPRPGEGKTVFITGATAGIGKATAIQFAQHGYRLILNGRRADRLQELKRYLETEFDVAVKVLAFDVSQAEAVKQAINSLEAAWHPIDILINNAGKARGFAPIHEGELEHWDDMIDTNIKGLLYLTRAISPYMVANQKGHIINVCSTVGKEVYPNGNVYCATKHAVDGLTKSMRLDLFKHNIKVSQVSPGAVEETEFALVRFDGDQERAAKTYEDFKPLTSADVAKAIYFIASQPAHVNVQDILMMGTQQASSMVIDRSGRDQFEEEE